MYTARLLAYSDRGMKFLGEVPCSALLLAPALFASACGTGGKHFTPPAPATWSRPTAAGSSSPSSAGWLDRLNYFRAIAGLPRVTENARWSDGGRKHAIYIVKNALVQHREDPDNAYYTPEGETAALQSNLFVGFNLDEPDRGALDTWMQSPFHAVGVLDPRLAQVGYGSYREAGRGPRTGAALNVIAGIRQTTIATYPVFWPGNGATIPMSLHWGGSPSPLTSCPGYTAPSGLPLILQIGPGNLTPVVSATSITANGRPLEHCVMDETSYVNPDPVQQNHGRQILGARDAIVLVPRDPLTPGLTYTASVSVNGDTHTWTFGIAGGAHAGARQSDPEVAGRKKSIRTVQR